MRPIFYYTYMNTLFPNNKSMHHEATEGGRGSTAVETMPLSEIVKQSPEEALKELELFSQERVRDLDGFFDYVREHADELKTDFEVRTTAEMKYQEHEKLMKDMYAAAMESAYRDTPEIFTQVIRLQQRLSSQFFLAGAPSGKLYGLHEMRLLSNPFSDPLFRTSLHIELDKNGLVDDRWEGVKKELDEQIFLSTKEKSPEIRLPEVPELTKNQLKELATLYRKMETDPAFRKQIEETKTQVIEPAPGKEKAPEKKNKSVLWKYAKKGLMYLAIGGAVAAGIYFLGPQVLAWAKDVLRDLFGQGPISNTARWINSTFETAREGISWIGDKIGQGWHWVSGIFKDMAAGREALRRGKEIADTIGGDVPDVPGIPRIPKP